MDRAEIIEDAITSRRSVRAFTNQPVPVELIERILKVASTAPSGSNIQPWKVHVVTGQKRDQLAAQLLEQHNNHIKPHREYEYYPTQWRSPYIERRRENGWGLYGTLGIQKVDTQAMLDQHGRNYIFFDAPAALFFVIDKDLEQGSWLDYGMFIQNIMVAARAHGLHTCPQAALASYPDVVRELLGISPEQTIVCGISLGYEDPDAKVNEFRATRIPVADFAHFHS